MVKHPDRQKYVRELNNAAKACGLQGIRDDVGQRLRAICQDINDNLEVDDLCRRFPKRLQALVDAKGERLST